MKTICRSAVCVAIGLLSTTIASAETWNVSSGSASWGIDFNWFPATAPNAVGASAVFNGAATSDNIDQTANRTATLDGTKTIGSLVFNNDLGTFTNTIA